MNSAQALRWLLIGMLLLATGVLHAEGGCPQGMIPYRGNDLNSCGPIPQGYYNNRRQQDQAPYVQFHWESRWGAIATDGPGGSFGSATDMQNQIDAENLALAKCHQKKGSGCQVELAYRNQCAAMAVGDTGHIAQAGNTPRDAANAAMKVCNGADTHCFIYYRACSLPVEVQ